MAGASATFTVAATDGAALSYEWSYNGLPVGSNSSVYTRSNCQLADDEGRVRVTLSNGESSIQSHTATLRVNPTGLNYYVATNGSSSNGGLSPDSPWSLAHALTKLGPGITLTLLPGVYDGGPVRIYYARGTEQNPVIVRSQHRWQAVIANSPGYGIEIYESQHVLLEGLCVSNSAKSGIKILDPNNTVRHCWITHNGNLTDLSGIESNSKSSTNNVIERNLVEFNAAFTHSASPQGHGIYLSGPNQIVRGNVIRNNGGWGLHFYSGYDAFWQNNAHIYNNLIYGHTNAAGVTLYGASSSGSLPGRNYFYNNTVLDGLNVEYGVVMITNNIILPCTRVPTQPIYHFSLRSSPTICNDYNLSTHAITPAGPHNMITNRVGFVNQANGLFWLQENSAARGKANSAVVPPVDFFGEPQALAADVGAFQYVPALVGDNRAFIAPSAKPDYWSGP